MADLSHNMSIVKLNVNGRNKLTKRQSLTEWMQTNKNKKHKTNSVLST